MEQKQMPVDPSEEKTEEPTKSQTQSYPGIQGPKARSLKENKPMDEETIKKSADPRAELGLKSPVADTKKGKIQGDKH